MPTRAVDIALLISEAWDWHYQSKNRGGVWQFNFRVTEFISFLFSESDLMSISDGSLKSYTCMVIYNCLLSPSQADQLVTMDGGQLVVSQVLVHLREEDNEWG